MYLRESQATMKGKIKVLFISTQNSARSQMAEGFLNHVAGELFQASSAGSEPGMLHPLAVEVMAGEGIDISGHQAKPLDPFLEEPFDFVVTVCDDANEACPIFPNALRRLHWSFLDPSRAEGACDERFTVFRTLRDAIRLRVEELVTAATPERGRWP